MSYLIETLASYRICTKWLPNEKKIFFLEFIVSIFFYFKPPINMGQLTVNCIDKNTFIFSVSTFLRASFIYLMVINNPLDDI